MDVTKYIGEATAYDKKLMLLEFAALPAKGVWWGDSELTGGLDIAP